MKAEPALAWRWWLKAIFVILWTFFLGGAYIWAHNPITGGILRGLGETLASIAIWLGVSWLGTALGHRVLGRWLGQANEPFEQEPATELALSAGTGLGLISLLVLGLGIIGLFYSWAAWLLVLALTILLRRDLRNTLSTTRELRLPRPSGVLQTWFLIYCFAVLLLAFFISLAPPTAFDSLVYHLTGPRLYIEAGQIGHLADIPHLGFPQLGQMQFALGMLLLGDGTAALFHFGYGLMAVAVTVALARNAFGREAAWFSAPILLSVPTLLWLLSQPYVDITLLFYATAAFFAFYRWRESHSRGEPATEWLIALGLFSGFGGSVKYTAVLVPVALGMSIVWVSRRDGLQAIVHRLAVVATLAGAIVLPWAFESWLTTGNPVYPFFIDDALYWDEWRSWWYDRPGTGLVEEAPWRLPLVPLEASILGTQGTHFYDATLGPLLLLSSGLLVAIWSTLESKEKGTVAHMLLFFLLSYFFWLSGVARTRLLMQTRLIILLFGIVAAFGGVAMARLPTLSRPQLNVDWLVRIVMAGVLTVTMFTYLVSFLTVNPLPEAIGLEGRDDYLTRRLGLHWPVIQEVNRLPADASVLFLWVSRSYPCEEKCWPDAILDRFLHQTHYYGYDADEMASAWRERGFTHVLLNQGGLEFVIEEGFDPVTERDLQVLEDLKKNHLQRVREWGDSYILYRLVP